MTRDDQAEATLCARSVAGDRTAFEALVRMHQSAVRKQLRRLTKGDDGLADEGVATTRVDLLTWPRRVSCRPGISSKNSGARRNFLPGSIALPTTAT